MAALPATSHVATRQFGDATVSIISEGAMVWAPPLQAPEPAWRPAMPEAGPDGELTLGLHGALIRWGAADDVAPRVLLDHLGEEEAVGYAEAGAAARSTWPTSSAATPRSAPAGRRWPAAAGPSSATMSTWSNRASPGSIWLPT